MVEVLEVGLWVSNWISLADFLYTYSCIYDTYRGISKGCPYRYTFRWRRV